MEPAELEKFIGDLEIAVDRLRSLYEQYFMGIEKIEPMVPRKDVDRRIQLLRKEQIRNTAQRFRFQMVLQRYNTYQTHWQRICREIENGTYKRHLQKAQKRFGDAPAPASQPATLASEPASVRKPAAPNAPSLSMDLEAELAELDRDFAPAGEREAPLELEDEGPAPARPAPPPPQWRKAEPSPHRKSVPPPPPPRGPTPLPASAGQPPPAPKGPPPPPRPASPPAQAGAGAPRPPVPGARQVPPPLAAARPSPAARPAAPAPAPAPAARPAPAPAATPAARAVAQPTLPSARTREAGPELPDERVRQLYAKYVETKRSHNESTAAITYDAVARSLRESSAKLREKHGKNVDFEVAVKDGKTILKPVLK